MTIATAPRPSPGPALFPGPFPEPSSDLRALWTQPGDPAPLLGAASAWRALGDGLLSARDELGRGVLRLSAGDSGWAGDGAAAFYDYWGRMDPAIEAQGAKCEVVVEDLLTLASQLATTRGRLDGLSQSYEAASRAYAAAEADYRAAAPGDPSGAVARALGAIADGQRALDEALPQIRSVKGTLSQFRDDLNRLDRGPSPPRPAGTQGPVPAGLVTAAETMAPSLLARGAGAVGAEGGVLEVLGPAGVIAGAVLAALAPEDVGAGRGDADPYWAAATAGPIGATVPAPPGGNVAYIKPDTKGIREVAREFEISPKGFGQFIEEEKARGDLGSANARGDYTHAELREKARQYESENPGEGNQRGSSKGERRRG